MPATYAHYRFGKDVYRALPKDIKQVIQDYRHAFCVGLHGPDVLFYYKPMEDNRVSEAGYDMHKKTAKPFFTGSRYLIRNTYQKDKLYAEEELSYILGFICHYALDHGCHGYIRSYEEANGVSHCEIETEFDCALLRIDGRDLSKYSLSGHIVPSLRNAQIVSEFFPAISDREALDSLRSMKHCIAIQQGRRPLQLFAMKLYARMTGKYHTLIGTVIKKHPDRRCEESNRRLLELYQKSVSIAVVLIKDYLNTNKELGGGFSHSYEGDR
ncbi:MAG: zinc dependent phospholipase C family protein [Lachnospiraceae bacterium]|nr:zinc dependent phospholipase C family protein [Lachnospiraceae bacterium]